MAEGTTPEVNQGEGNGDLQFMLQRIYVKDLSFESPLGIEAFTKNWQPKITQDINNVAKKVDDDHYEVVLKLTVSASIAEQTVFLVEVQQAGLFFIKGVEGPQLAQIFNTLCPQILFPYAREVVDSCALKGGFPGLALPPINFDALFFRAVQQAQSAQHQSETERAVTN
jgi:preprotein translocase subunit SecB